MDNKTRDSEGQFTMLMNMVEACDKWATQVKGFKDEFIRINKIERTPEFKLAEITQLIAKMTSFMNEHKIAMSDRADGSPRSSNPLNETGDLFYNQVNPKYDIIDIINAPRKKGGRKSSSSRRRRSSKKRATQRKQKKRSQHRRSRRSH